MKKCTYKRFKDYFHFDHQYYLIPKLVLNSEVSDNAKVLFTTLHGFRGDTNTIKVNNKKLSSTTGISEESISKILKELEEKEFISRGGRGYNRWIKTYKNFEEIHDKGEYTRIPAFIVEHQEMTSKHKVLYFILLDIYFYYLNIEIKKVEKVSDLYTKPQKRSSLAKRLGCSEDSLSEYIKDLAEKFSYENRFIINTDKTAYYSDWNCYKCNLITPTTKEGLEQLKEDKGIVGITKDNFNFEDDLLVADSQSPPEPPKEMKETPIIVKDGVRILKNSWGNRFKIDFNKLSDGQQAKLKETFYTLGDKELLNKLKEISVKIYNFKLSNQEEG